MNSKRKRRNKRIKITIGLISIIFLAVLSLSVKSNISKLERIIKTAGLYSINVITYPFDIVEDFLITKEQEKETLKEAFKMQEKINELEKEIDDLNKEKKEINELKNSIDLELIENNNSIVAKVINRNIGVWNEEFTINKGEKDGVKKGSVVKNKEGLIGTVSEVTDYYSTVRIITSNDQVNISVKLITEEKEIYGILKSFKDNLFSIELLDKSNTVKAGDLIVTTGLSSNYIEGITVGSVESLEYDSFGLSQIVKAKSNVNFNDLKYVEIIGDKN